MHESGLPGETATRRRRLRAHSRTGLVLRQGSESVTSPSPTPTPSSGLEDDRMEKGRKKKKGFSRGRFRSGGEVRHVRNRNAEPGSICVAFPLLLLLPPLLLHVDASPQGSAVAFVVVLCLQRFVAATVLDLCGYFAPS